MNKTNHSLFSLLIISIAALLGSQINLSLAIGSYSLSFSLFALLLPLLGAYAPLGQSCLLVSILYSIKCIFYGAPLTMGLPTLAATPSWSTNQNRNQKIGNFLNLFLHIIIPIVCIILFNLHPVGRHAFLYSWYWFIPITVYLLERKNIQITFLKALQSTFIAHAIGSVIWLYRVPMSSTQWLDLIPLVAIERLTFACASTLLYVACKKITNTTIVSLRFNKTLKKSQVDK